MYNFGILDVLVGGIVQRGEKGERQSVMHRKREGMNPSNSAERANGRGRRKRRVAGTEWC